MTLSPIITTPGGIPYIHWKGDPWIPGTITADIAGTPINFTGYTAVFTLYNTLSGQSVKVLTSSPNAGITLSSVGVITLTMTAAETAALSTGDYDYTLVITSPSSVPKTYTYGIFSLVDKSNAN